MFRGVSYTNKKQYYCHTRKSDVYKSKCRYKLICLPRVIRKYIIEGNKVEETNEKFKIQHI